MPATVKTGLGVADLPSENPQQTGLLRGIRKKRRRLLLFPLSLLMAASAILFALQQETVPPELSPLPDENNNVITLDPSNPARNEKAIIGFLPSWMLAKQVKVYPERLTQIIYFGLAVNSNGSLIKYKQKGAPVFEWTYFNSEAFKTIRAKASTSHAKIIIALKNFDNESIDTFISNPPAIVKLVAQVKKLITDYQLNGVNIDFEYVTKTDFPTASYFNRFLEIFVHELKKHDTNLIVSLDLNATSVIKDPAYDLVKIGALVDQIILMGYDFHQTDSYNAGPVAPLEADVLEMSISKAVNSLRGRVPFTKLILGIPFYGYEWQTVSTQYKSITIPHSGALATWGRVHDLIAERKNMHLHWEEKSQSPWLVYRQSGAIKQIYYEDQQSLAAKLNFVQQNNLAGIAIWALGYEGNYTQPWGQIESTFAANRIKK